MSHHSDGRASSSRGSGNSRHSNGRPSGPLPHIHRTQPFTTNLPPLLQVKSKFDAEWRRFSLTTEPSPPTYEMFRRLVEKLHHLAAVPFTLCYTSSQGDLLPITNDENLRKSFESAKPALRLLIQRKGESWEEKYGYGTDSNKKGKGISRFLTKCILKKM